MSNRHITASWELDLTPRNLLVALAMADRACEDCGCAWPGRADLQRRTKLGKTAVDEALKELEFGARDRAGRQTSAGGHLVAIANAKGGRGRAVIYIVLPQLEGLQAAPCRACQARMVGALVRETAAEKQAAARDLSGDKGPATREVQDRNHTARRDVSGNNHTATRDVSEKPPAAAAVNLPLSRDANPPQSDAAANGCAISAARQPSVNLETSARAHTRTRESHAAAARPPSTAPPVQPSVGETLRGLFPGLHTAPELDRVPMSAGESRTASIRTEGATPVPRRDASAGRRIAGPMQPIGDVALKPLQALCAGRAP